MKSATTTLKVLVVEDDPTEAGFLKEMLDEIGHDLVGSVHNGEDAVKTAQETSPDLVLMDIRLPGKDGVATAKEILATQSAGMIFISGYDDEEFISGAKEAGGVAFLLKPVNSKQLEAAIEVGWARFKDLIDLNKQVAHLEESLETRKVVERAKGILMLRLAISEEDAYRRLQKRARDTNQKLRQVASAVIEAADAILWQE